MSDPDALKLRVQKTFASALKSNECFKFGPSVQIKELQALLKTKKAFGDLYNKEESGSGTGAQRDFLNEVLKKNGESILIGENR